MVNYLQSRSVVSLGRCRIVNADAVGSQIGVHHHRWLCVYSCHPGLGRFSAILFSPSIDRTRVRTVRAFGCSVFRWRKSESWRARSNRWVIAVFAIIGFLNAYLPAYTDRKELWTIDGDTIRWVGVALFAAGALRIWPVFVLGERFSGLVAIQPGAYSRSQRHLRSYPSPQLSWPCSSTHSDGASLFGPEWVSFLQCCLFRRC
jgi:hypothetical protein